MGRLSAALLAIVCTVLAGCSAPADTQEEAHNRADVFFVHRMIEHGAQAAQAAKLVENRTTNATVSKLAKAIAEATDAESPQLTALTGPRDAAKPAGTSESIPGAIKPGKLAELTGLTGNQFTSAWLDTMIVHHRGAITIAETELAQGKFAEAKALARRIIDTRQPQLDIMQGMTGG
jgi:uncharacterized protein (DUF305 family)